MDIFITIIALCFLGCSQSISYLETEIPNSTPNTSTSSELMVLEKMQKISSMSNWNEIQKFCSKNQEVEIQDICKRYTQRSHLFTSKGATEEKTSSELCAQSDIQCWEKYAHSSTSIEQVANVCSQIKNKRWRQECYFTTAETWLQKSPKNYKKSNDLCTNSGNFYSNCVEHATITLVRKEYTIPQAISAAKDISEYWYSKEKVKEQQLNLFWFTYLDMYRQKSRGIGASLYEKLPIEASPHITSYITHTVIASSSEQKSIDDWKHIIQQYHKTKEHIQLKLKPQKRTPSDRTKNENCSNCIIFFNHNLRKTSDVLEEDIELSIQATLEMSTIKHR